MDEIKKSLTYQFEKIHLKLIAPLQKALHPLGITEKNFFVMQLINANPGISQNGLAEILMRDKTLVRQVVDKLEDKQLAQRTPVKNDRRVYALYLTEEGKKMVEGYKHITKDSESALLASLNTEDEATLRRVLYQLMEQL
jgi:DNA-binding MarR family transcriptional regulator